MEVNAPPLLQVHDYWTYHNRYEIVAGWYEHHGKGIWPENLLPPLACIVEADGIPVVTLSCYESIGIGVCHLDWVVTNPDAPRIAPRATMFGITALAAAAKEHGYGIMLTATFPTAARALERKGWVRNGTREHLFHSTTFKEH